MPFTFKKAERLCSQKTIALLFAEGGVVVKYPFRAVFLAEEAKGPVPCVVMMNVSKKKFKRANKRNLLRRRMKEAYRLQKDVLFDALKGMNVQLTLALIYLPKEELEYADIEKGMRKFIAKLIGQLLPVKSNQDGE